MKVLLAFILASTTAWATSPRTYRVVLPQIPLHLNPWTNQVNTDQYLLYQMYYPLLERRTGEGFASHFLDIEKTRALSPKFDQFELCLREEVRFCDSSPMSTDDLLWTMQEAHRREHALPPVKAIAKHDRCVSVTLRKGHSLYLDLLTSITVTPLKKESSGGAAPVGLGPFCVKSWKKDRISLRRNGEARPEQFGEIEFLAVHSNRALETRLDDINHVFGPARPKIPQSNMQTVERETLKTYAIVVSIKDTVTRKAVASCIRPTGLEWIMKLKLEPVPGVLARGLPGFQEVFRQGRCRAISKVPALEWLAFRGEDAKALQEQLDKQRLPFKIRVRTLAPDEVQRRVFGGSDYVAVIGFDSSGHMPQSMPEAGSFFEAFYKDQRVIAEPISELSDLVRSAIEVHDLGTKTHLYRRAHRVLLDSGYVIPMGQFKERQVYPAAIRNIVWRDQWAGIPAIDEMEWRP